METVLDVQAGLDRRLQEVAPGRREPATLGRDSYEGRGGLEPQRLGDGAHDRDLPIRLPHSLRVEDRHGRMRAVGDAAAHRLAVMRVSRLALSEDQVALLW